MVEKRRWLDVLSYAVVIAGIVVIAFPVYLALIASTHTAEAVEAAPMSLIPGDLLIDNYRKVLFEGGDIGSRAPVGRMMLVSLTMAVGIAVGKIIISLLSAFAIVDAVTQGGPGQETSILVYKVYHDGFKALDFGGSAAQSVILMTIVIALTVLQFRFIERKVNY